MDRSPRSRANVTSTITVNNLENGPTVMVHRGWRPGNTSSSNSTCNSAMTSPSSGVQEVEKVEEAPVRTKRKSNQASKFQFINTTRPNQTRDVEMQRSVRRHARNQRLGGRRMPAPVPASKSSTSSPLRHSPPTTVTMNKPLIIPPPSILGDPTSLTAFTYPIPMSRGAHALLSSYLTHVSTRMFPLSLSRILSSNPLRSTEWFCYAISDEAMLSAILFAAAVYLLLLSRTQERETEMLHWQARTMALVQARLRSGDTEVLDSTIGAISCLALAEAVLGNEDLWHMHMRGLQNLLLSRSRGCPSGALSAPLSIEMSMERLNPVMRAKLLRSDISGAIDYNLSPYLSSSFISTTPYSPGVKTKHTWSILPPATLQLLSKQVSSLLSPLIGTDPPLLSSLITLVHFTHAIQFASLTPGTTLDPYIFSSDLYAIESALLTRSHTPESPFELNPFSPSFEVGALDTTAIQCEIDKALRLASLLYLKSILQEFPHSATGPQILLSQLRTALQDIQVSFPLFFLTPIPIDNNVPDPQIHALTSALRWTGTIGALLATGDMRGWFVAFLAMPGLEIDDVVVGRGESGLEGLLSLERVFGIGAVGVLGSEVAYSRVESAFLS